MLSTGTFAEESLAAPENRETFEKSRAEREAKQRVAKWNVRVEVLMVALPEATALAMLPDLRDPAKSERAFAMILDGIGKKEARLIGYPFDQVTR